MIKPDEESSRFLLATAVRSDWRNMRRSDTLASCLFPEDIGRMLTLLLATTRLVGGCCQLHADNNRTLKDTCGVLCKSGEVVEQLPHHHPLIFQRVG